jgi:hypothetical protein
MTNFSVWAIRNDRVFLVGCLNNDRAFLTFFIGRSERWDLLG